MIKGLILRTNGEIEYYEYDGNYKELQKIVNGYIEAIPFGEKPYFAYVNEESKILKLEQNRIATDLWYDSGQRILIGDYIAGDVIFFGSISFEGNDTNYPEKLKKDLSKYVEIL